MNKTAQDVIREIDAIVWDPETSDIQKTHLVQGLLYQWDQMQDNQSDRLHNWQGYDPQFEPKYKEEA